jgi:hypothetical protein
MKRRTWLTIFTFVVGGIIAGIHAEPKAYDLVKYQGKAGGVTIAFDFADGYPEASTMKITDGKKTTTFNLEGLDKIQFVPAKGGGSIKRVSLDLSGDDRAPAKVTGSYVAGERTVAFTLTKRK